MLLFMGNIFNVLHGRKPYEANQTNKLNNKKTIKLGLQVRLVRYRFSFIFIAVSGQLFSLALQRGYRARRLFAFFIYFMIEVPRRTTRSAHAHASISNTFRN